MCIFLFCRVAYCRLEVGSLSSFSFVIQLADLLKCVFAIVMSAFSIGQVFFVVVSVILWWFIQRGWWLFFREQIMQQMPDAAQCDAAKDELYAVIDRKSQVDEPFLSFLVQFKGIVGSFSSMLYECACVFSEFKLDLVILDLWVCVCFSEYSWTLTIPAVWHPISCMVKLRSRTFRFSTQLTRRSRFAFLVVVFVIVYKLCWLCICNALTDTLIFN